MQQFLQRRGLGASCLQLSCAVLQPHTRGRRCVCGSSTPQEPAGPLADPAQQVAAVVERQQQQQHQLLDKQQLDKQPGRQGPGVETQNRQERAAAGAASSSGDKELLFKALLAIILQLSQPELHDQQQQQQQQQKKKMEAFLQSQPVSTSIPFISWLADLEAQQAAGPFKAQLAGLCELLLMVREQQDRQGQEALYADSLRLLSGGNEQAAALMRADPRQYALALAEGMTGKPLVLQGYGPTYDVLLQVAPPAALTPTAVAQGHALAEELGADLSARRKSTLAAMLGRVRVDSLGPEQQAALMGPSPAARILNLLLSLGSSEQRLALLPDCFTPPPDEAATNGLDMPAAAAAAAAAAGPGETGRDDTDELWCTPMQLLNEIDSRLQVAAEAATGGSKAGSNASGSGQGRPALLASGTGMHAGDEPFSAEVVPSLQELRQHIQSQWLQSLPQHVSAPHPAAEAE